MRSNFIIILIILIVFSTNLVIAQECSDEQTILRLSQTTNSHGSLWDEESYSERVCYEEIFGGPYSGANPHQCTTNNGNKVIGLSQTTNSHAESKEQTTYTNNVCFGDLISHTINYADGERCNNNEKVVLSLSQETNAHIALGNNPSYNFKICSNSASAPILPQCRDTIDNDEDDDIDAGDSDCLGPNNVYNPNDPLEGTTQCNDGRDNDGDGPIDTADSDCSNSNDPSEGNNQCRDTIDNDGDGPIDTADSDCLNPNDPLEGTTQCNDGRDNDGDTLIDYCLADGSNAGTCDPDCEDDNDPIEGVTGFEVSGAYWSNMRDIPIDEADLNDLVKLKISGENLENKNVEYEIWKVDGGFLWFDEQITSQTATGGFITWRAGKKESDGSLSGGNYYFIATVEGEEKDSRDSENFGILTVLNEPDNSPPVADIINPIDKAIYFQNELLNFRQNSYDEDDGFSYTWKLGDSAGTTKTGNTVNRENYEFTYSYTDEPGQKNIELNVVDDRGSSEDESKDIHLILIINDNPTTIEKYILAYIDLPRFGEAYGRIVDFDATSTYAIQEEPFNNNIKLTCLAGKCPAETEGCLQNVCDINVVNAPTETQPPNYIPITFSWLFKRGETNTGDKIASGSSGALFTYTFPMVGFYIAELTASINPSSSTRTEFDVRFGNPTCVLIDDEEDINIISGSSIGESYWLNPDGSYINSINSCYDEEGINQKGLFQDTCCPQNSICDDTLVPAQCKFDSRNKCQEFTTVDECNDANPTVAREELNSVPDFQRDFPGGCGDGSISDPGYYERTEENGVCYDKFLNCKCIWKDNKCQADSGHYKLSCDSPISSITKTGECVFDITYQDSCDTDGLFGRSWTAVWEDNSASSNSPEYCKDGSDTLSCGQIVKLPFFNFFNLIITMLSLITIYYFLIKKQEQKIIIN